MTSFAVLDPETPGPGLVAFAKAKSISWAAARVSMMLPGLRSRWAMPCRMRKRLAPRQWQSQSSGLQGAVIALCPIFPPASRLRETPSPDTRFRPGCLQIARNLSRMSSRKDIAGHFSLVQNMRLYRIFCSMWLSRDVEARLKRSAKTRPVIVLTGARQTGGGGVSRTPSSFPFPNGFRASPVTEIG
jgi:hypothetical protein